MNFGCHFVEVTRFSKANKDAAQTERIGMLCEGQQDLMSVNRRSHQDGVGRTLTVNRHRSFQSLALSRVVDVRPKRQTLAMHRFRFRDCNAKSIPPDRQLAPE